MVQIVYALAVLTAGFLQMHHWPILALTTLKIKKRTILKRAITALRLPEPALRLVDASLGLGGTGCHNRNMNAKPL
jgi:hypothetical protein